MSAIDDYEASVSWVARSLEEISASRARSRERRAYSASHRAEVRAARAALAGVP